MTPLTAPICGQAERRNLGRRQVRMILLNMRCLLLRDEWEYKLVVIEIEGAAFVLPVSPDCPHRCIGFDARVRTHALIDLEKSMEIVLKWRGFALTEFRKKASSPFGTTCEFRRRNDGCYCSVSLPLSAGILPPLPTSSSAQVSVMT